MYIGFQFVFSRIKNRVWPSCYRPRLLSIIIYLELIS